MLEICKANWSLSALALALVVLAPLTLPPARAEEKLLTFADIEGTWKGFGWFYFTYGNRSRARCTATIRQEGGPDKGNLVLNCVAGAMHIDAKAFDIVLNGASATGAWTIPSFDVQGSLTGQVSPDSLSAHLQPAGEANAGYGATLKAKLNGTCRVALTQTVDSPLDLKKLDLNLRRC